jgi:streptogramin lyase
MIACIANHLRHQLWRPYRRVVRATRLVPLLVVLVGLLTTGAATTALTAVPSAVVQDRIRVGGQPLGVAGTPDAVWVSDFEAASLVRIDRVTGAQSRLTVPPFPGELTYARGALWVTTRSKVLVRVDPVARRVVARIPVGDTSDDVTAAAGSIWVANYRSATVSRVNPRSNRTAKTIKIPIVPGGGVSGIAAAGGYVWVGQTQGASVFRIDPRSNKVKEVRTGPLRAGPLGPAWLAGAGPVLWVSNIYEGTVMRLDPVTGRVLKKVEVGRDPVNLELIGTEVWVPNDQVDTVTRLDALTGAILQVVPTAANPAVVGGVEGEAWVTMFDAGQVWRLVLSPVAP